MYASADRTSTSYALEIVSRLAAQGPNQVRDEPLHSGNNRDQGNRRDASFMANSVITGSAAAETAFATGHMTTVRFLGVGLAPSVLLRSRSRLSTRLRAHGRARLGLLPRSFRALRPDPAGQQRPPDASRPPAAQSRPGYAALWEENLAYYLTCDLFDGRKPPDYRRLDRFSVSGASRRVAKPPPERGIPAKGDPDGCTRLQARKHRASGLQCLPPQVLRPGYPAFVLHG